MKTKEVILAIEDIIQRADLPPVVLEECEIALLEEVIIHLKRYIVLQNKTQSLSALTD